jgi:hypothetical protein
MAEHVQAEKPQFLQKITENIVGYVLSLCVGAVFVVLMQNGAKEARLAVIEKQLTEQAAEIKEIQKTMAEGGPAALQQRVDALYKIVENQSTKLDRIIELATRPR